MEDELWVALKGKWPVDIMDPTLIAWQGQRSQARAWSSIQG